MLRFCSGSAWAQHADFHVVPLPKEVKNTRAGSFELNARTLIAYPKSDKAMKRNAEYLAAFIKGGYGAATAHYYRTAAA